MVPAAAVLAVFAATAAAKRTLAPRSSFKPDSLTE